MKPLFIYFSTLSIITILSFPVLKIKVNDLEKHFHAMDANIKANDFDIEAKTMHCFLSHDGLLSSSHLLFLILSSFFLSFLHCFSFPLFLKRSLSLSFSITLEKIKKSITRPSNFEKGCYNK